MTPRLRQIESVGELLAETPLASWAAGALRQYRDGPDQVRVVYLQSAARLTLGLDGPLAAAAHWTAVTTDSPVPHDAVLHADIVVWEMSAMRLFPAIGIDLGTIEAPVWIVVQRANRVTDRAGLEAEVLPEYLRGLPDGSRFFVEPDPDEIRQALVAAEHGLTTSGTTRRDAHLLNAFRTQVDDARKQAATARTAAAKAVDREAQAVRAHRTKASAAAHVVLAPYLDAADTVGSLRTALHAAIAAWAEAEENPAAEDNGSPHEGLQQAIDAAAQAWAQEVGTPALHKASQAAASNAVAAHKELADGFERRAGTAPDALAEPVPLPDGLVLSLAHLVESFSLSVPPVLGEWRSNVENVFDKIRDAREEADAKPDDKEGKPAPQDSEDGGPPWWERIPARELEARYLRRRTEKDADRAVRALQQQTRDQVAQATETFGRSLSQSVRTSDEANARLDQSEAVVSRYDDARDLLASA